MADTRRIVSVKEKVAQEERPFGGNHGPHVRRDGWPSTVDSEPGERLQAAVAAGWKPIQAG